MADYKEMYLTMFRACAQAAYPLIAAQRECEDRYIRSPGPQVLTLAPPFPKPGGAEDE